MRKKVAKNRKTKQNEPTKSSIGMRSMDSRESMTRDKVEPKNEKHVEKKRLKI